MRPQPSMRFLLPILFSAAMVAVPEMAISQEIPYDYHHASSCFGYPGTNKYPLLGSHAHPLGYIYNPNPNTLALKMQCPVSRIYPRHPGRLVQVVVDLSTQENLSLIRGISVCAVVASLERGEESPVCATKTVPGGGRQQVIFDTNDLVPVINVPFGWDYYMFITVDQYYLDRLYGYQTRFNLD